MKHKFTHPKDTNEWHKWVTVDGRRAEQVIAFDVDGGRNRPSIAAVIDGNLITFSSDGFSDEGVLRIIDAPRTRTVWVNFDSDGIAFPYDTKADALADDYDNDIIARKRVEYVEGEFDE